MSKKTEDQFQTPMPVANYMASLIPFEKFPGLMDILEPTPGNGNLIAASKEAMRKTNSVLLVLDIDSPDNFFRFQFKKKYDTIIMNPPFSEKTAYGIPKDLDLKGMRLGYYILRECMKISDNIIALMLWFTLLDSDVRMRELKAFGIKSLTSFPRKTFEYARIQTVVIELQRDYAGETIFKTFNY